MYAPHGVERFTRLGDAPRGAQSRDDLTQSADQIRRIRDLCGERPQKVKGDIELGAFP
ncbi:MAG: hypothetical protein ACYDGW_08300 [Vulcanimicrobiaceae bacterium]